MDDLMSIGFDFSRLSEVKSSQIDDTLLGIHGKDLDDLKEELQHYERLGMEKDATRIMMRIKEGAVATFLQNLGFRLLMIDEPDGDGDIRIFHIETSGDHKEVQIGETRHHFHRTLLKDYTRSIPLEILRKLPDEAGLKTYVFSPNRDLDPILAFQMTWSETKTQTFVGSILRLKKRTDLLVPLYCPYWIGLYEWE